MEEKFEKVKKIGNWIATILLGDMRDTIIRIDERIKYLVKDIDEIKPKISKLETVLNEMKPKFDILWKEEIAPAHSPRRLNEKGESILNQSGIKKMIEDKTEWVLNQVKEKRPQNAYQAQEIIIETILMLKNDTTLKDKLENGAFVTGVDIDTVLFVGAIYIRDKILERLNFKIEDLNRKVS